jgi:putative phage-type endonuclease
VSGPTQEQVDEYQEWLNARLGKLTASRIAKAIKQTKSGWSTSRRDLIVELLAEKLTGMPTQSYISQAVQWGLETEPQARAAYERKTGESVTVTGFVDHPRIPNAGCSPDGLVGYDGLVEIKCPESRTHISYLLDGMIPEEYRPQLLWQLACTDRKWVDFVSFDPRMPIGANLFIKRLDRDDKEIEGIEKLAVGFLVEMVHALNKIENPHVLSDDV